MTHALLRKQASAESHVSEKEREWNVSAISFPEPTCLLVSAKTRVLVLTKRHVGSGNETDVSVVQSSHII